MRGTIFLSEDGEIGCMGSSLIIGGKIFTGEVET